MKKLDKYSQNYDQDQSFFLGSPHRLVALASASSSFVGANPYSGPLGDGHRSSGLSRGHRYSVLVLAVCFSLYVISPLLAGDDPVAKLTVQEISEKVRLHFEEAVLLAGDSKYGAAVKELDRILELAPDFELAGIYRELFKRRAELAKQVLDLEDIVDKNPHNAEALYDLGLLKMNLGNYERAFEIFDKARELDKESELINKALAEAYHKRLIGRKLFGERKSSRRVWQPALQIAPCCLNMVSACGRP